MTDIEELARRVIATEIEAIRSIGERIDNNLSNAVEIILKSPGRVVVVGMGKSGIIGQKIAATLASTGTPSFFVHPGEAFHGDLGMIRPIDVALLISNSGETEEVIRLLPFLQWQKNPVIAITGNRTSTLAQNADAVLDVWVDREACNINLAPTSSTTATLVMGDALAVVLSTLKDFQPEDFARFHPGGSLGRRLLTRVADVMHKTDLPICGPEASFRDVVQQISRGRLGMTLVMEEDVFLGLITDGDVRRAFDAYSDYRTIRASDIMTRSPFSIAPDMRFADAEELMRNKKINVLIVRDETGKVVGVLQVYDLIEDKRDFGGL